MKVKELNLKKKLKSDKSKNISRNFSGAGVGSVGSIQGQTVFFGACNCSQSL